MAVVNSTTPRPAPKCPPVTDTASMVSWRNSSATWRTCSTLSLRKSSGVRIVSRSGVLLNTVTAIFQFLHVGMSSDENRLRMSSAAIKTRRSGVTWEAQARFVSLATPPDRLTSQIVQRDAHHPKASSPVPVDFLSHLKCLPPAITRVPTSLNGPWNSKLYTKAAPNANPVHPKDAADAGRRNRPDSTLAECRWFHSAQKRGIGMAGAGVFKLLPGPFAGGPVAGGDGQGCGGQGDPLAERDGTADDHEEVIGIGLLVGHHELEVHAEKLPAKFCVVLGLDEIAKPYRHDGGIAPFGPKLDAVAGDRVELVKVHHILARLAVDPVDRRFDRELPQVVAELPRHLVES